MAELIGRDKCCGCGACAVVCPKGCIELREDAEGFRYPEVTRPEACVSCGGCTRVCPAEKQSEGAILDAWAAQNKDAQALAQSTSGGVFSALAEDVLRTGGVVWGVEMTPDWQTRYACVGNESELARLRGSKYVECAECAPYQAVADQLRAGKRVLFCGTPCTAKALDSFLRTAACPGRDNLLLVDLFCYGIQSQRVWRQYVSEINPEGRRLSAIAMRRKEPCWEIYAMDIAFADGTHYARSRWEDPWLKGYSKALFNRPACEHCTAKGFPRASDLTLGDFWAFGAADLPREMDPERGLSVVVVGSARGAQAYERIRSRLRDQHLGAEKLARLYPRLGQANKASADRAEFLDACGKIGFSRAIDRFVGDESEKRRKFAVRRLKRRVKRALHLK